MCCVFYVLNVLPVPVPVLVYICINMYVVQGTCTYHSTRKVPGGKSSKYLEGLRMRQHRRSRHGFLAIGHSFGNKFIGHFFVPQGGVGVGVGCARGEEEEQLEEVAVGRGHR